jgi:hypothetical protein
MVHSHCAASTSRNSFIISSCLPSDDNLTAIRAFASQIAALGVILTFYQEKYPACVLLVIDELEEIMKLKILPLLKK